MILEVAVPAQALSAGQARCGGIPQDVGDVLKIRCFLQELQLQLASKYNETTAGTYCASAAAVRLLVTSLARSSWLCWPSLSSRMTLGPCAYLAGCTPASAATCALVRLPCKSQCTGMCKTIDAQLLTSIYQPAAVKQAAINAPDRTMAVLFPAHVLCMISSMCVSMDHMQVR